MCETAVISYHRTAGKAIDLHSVDPTIDVYRILAISLSYYPREDKLFWYHSDSGVYNVKFGYHLAESLERKDTSSSSNSPRKWWDRFWKISYFTTCTLCDGVWESVGHALFRCTRARAIWNQTQFQVFSPKINNLNGHDIYSTLAAAYKDSDLEKILCLMWCIWTERNKELHGTKPKLPRIICSFPDVYLEQFYTAKLPPAYGFHKLNVDATYDAKGSVIDVGAVIRDYFGDVIVAFSKPLRGCYSTKEMEANSIIYNFKWALSNRLAIHSIETDSLIVANTINKLSSTSCVSHFRDLIDDISLLLSYFPRVIVSHVKRETNKAAHGLTKFSLRLDNDCSWLGEILSPIYSVIVFDSIH
ncbi:uncharacterized protein LOC115723351 [Cannabis sativa]|uniref:uncharacterized protein LOC115723351 n=1 Tax=Cannabis sativa TaxID=3483 RepID=UPI0029CA1AEC|nr:uncharacterized protein LOC115723351 [Cannabis sativa]